MEGSNDYRCKSRLGRSLSDDHAVKTWMAGTSPAMTNLEIWANPSPQRLQFAWQRIGPLRDVAGAETDDEIAARRDAMNHAGEIGGILQRNHFAMAVRAQAQHEMVAVDARYRRLAGRIDFGDDDRVGIVEAGAEFLEQRLQPREPMRLHHGDDFALAGFPRRPQHRRDFHGMMAVIVDDGDAVPFAGAGKTPPHAAEAGERLPDGLVGESEFM